VRLVLALALALLACGRPRPVVPPPATPDVNAELALAEAAERERKHDVAREHYEKAVAAAHDPSSIALARWKFAETLITWGELPEARRHLETAVASKPDAVVAWHDLGHVRLGLGDKPGAKAALTRARDLAPHEVSPRKSLAVLLWQMGDFAGAKAEYKAMLGLELPDSLRTKVEWAIGELDNLQKR
jgi:tetratricopeptide (TPR) repeat protein